MKADPTKAARKLASEKSRDGSYVYIDKMIYSDTDIRYKVSAKKSVRTVMVYKNGSEIAL